MILPLCSNRRASTWWTFVCGLLVQARYLAAQEDQLECIVNGVDKLVVKEEELNNMRAISQLLLLWLQLSLGSIPTHNALLSRSHVGREAPKLGSAMWELEEISGNISMVESFHASSTMVRNIESLLGCLTERFADHKMSKSPAARHPSTIYNDYELAWRVNITLVQASTMCSSKIIAIPATSFAALLLCMQANRQDRSPMSAQRVDLIIKICAAVSLQLRDIFGDTEGLDSGSLSNGDLLISHMRARALSTAAMDEALVAVTMVEAIAHTFEGLLDLSSSDASPSNGNEVGDIFDLSDEAHQHVVEKLGVIMGILCTIIDCFDNIPKRGKRAKQTASKLAGLRTRLEELNVQADVSFAFEVALSSSGSSQEATQETHPGVKQEPSFDFPSNTNELMPSQSSSNLQQTGPWAYEEVAAFDSSSYSRLAAGSQCNRAEAPSSYQTSPYVNHYAAQQPTGHVRYGPGPLSAAFREEKSSGEGSPDTRYPFTFGADLPGQHYHEPPARTTGYSESTTFSSAAYSGSAQAQSLPYSYTAESSAHKTHIALASGQGVWEPTPGYAATRGYTQATQSYAGDRIAPVRFTDNYVEWH
ncbi:hypothetical protein NDA13_000573 [Ustilago tritici]|nr:hypothetical protein NDA13_000573 [Ustilago tritici]